MEFKDKLSFLIRLSGVSGKELSDSTGIPPSTISLYRSGKRKRPRKDDHLQAFASYFAMRLTSDYQRQALAEYTQGKLILDSRETVLAKNQLLCWMKDATTNDAASVLSLIEAPALQSSLTGDYDSDAAAAAAHSQNFWGVEGKRQALRALIAHLHSVAVPGTLYVNVDEDAEWLVQDVSLAFQFMRTLAELVERGFKIVQILPPSSVSHFYDILNQWFPLYMTGGVQPYYYPRLRDNVYRGTFIALKGEIALSSLCVAGRESTACTSLTVDSRGVESVAAIIENLRDLCLPAIDTRSGYEAAVHAIEPVERKVESVISFRAKLPLELIPAANYEYAIEHAPDANAARSIENLRERIDQIVDDGRGEVITMGHLASAAAVRAGEEPMNVAGLDVDRCPKHTPETYAAHLEAILAWMAENPKHTFVPLTQAESVLESLIVCHGQRALVAHYDAEFKVFEFTEPVLMQVAEEYLLQRLERESYRGLGRKRIENQLTDLIAQLRAK